MTMEPDIEHMPPASIRSLRVNLISDAIVRCGWVPFSVRQRAAKAALEVVAEWEQVDDVRHREAVRQGLTAPEAAPPGRGALWSVLAALMIGVGLLGVGAVLTFAPVTATNQWEYVAVLAALFVASVLLHWYDR